MYDYFVSKQFYCCSPLTPSLTNLLSQITLRHVVQRRRRRGRPAVAEGDGVPLQAELEADLREVGVVVERPCPALQLLVVPLVGALVRVGLLQPGDVHHLHADVGDQAGGDVHRVLVRVGASATVVDDDLGAGLP